MLLRLWWALEEGRVFARRDPAGRGRGPLEEEGSTAKQFLNRRNFCCAISRSLTPTTRQFTPIWQTDALLPTQALVVGPGPGWKKVEKVSFDIPIYIYKGTTRVDVPRSPPAKAKASPRPQPQHPPQNPGTPRCQDHAPIGSRSPPKHQSPPALRAPPQTAIDWGREFIKKQAQFQYNFRQAHAEFPNIPQNLRHR